MPAQQIIALGGGGFSMEPDNLALDRYILQQTSAARPKVCFLPQASAESREYVSNFYKAFTDLDAHPTWLSLFGSVAEGWREMLLDQDVIYVGGGNTRSMLAIWREWGVDQVLREALERGVILAGISAGAICWFEQGLTDSVAPLGVLPCLGFLPGSCSPHFDGESNRRPAFHRYLKQGQIQTGIALDDGAAAHFTDGELDEVVTSRPDAHGYQLDLVADKVVEMPLPVRYLLD